jgi:hypothetical protein
VAAAIVLLTSKAPGQAMTNSTPSTSEEVADHQWSFSASVDTSFVPDDRDFVAAAFTADRGWLHLEAHYNYEDLETGSLWAGYNLSVGEQLVLEATPMLGGVFGNTTGIAPSSKLSLSYGRFELSGEGGYLFDVGHSSGSFFYIWSELTYSPVDWLQVGLVATRSNAYETDLGIERGFSVGFSYKRMDFTTYVFNLGWDAPTVTFSVGVHF